MSGRPAAAAATARLEVDRIACDAVGICAQVAPGLVELDEWGYPLMRRPAGARDVRAALRAARACPRAALWLADGPA